MMIRDAHRDIGIMEWNSKFTDPLSNTLYNSVNIVSDNLRKERDRNPFFFICRREIIIFVHSKLESLYFLDKVKKMFSKVKFSSIQFEQIHLLLFSHRIAYLLTINK